ncbi:hypothetical protein EJ02DRAFT_424432 [Clathrospora elynae]|uniref:Chitinase n=1 Tax=Clathrospora elynae TaxID=706981 RepID=A0A6A5SH12_9PLEO|nr:hypothetical protein EJ02DRAFT_424432 [Clathrospora elynae]
MDPKAMEVQFDWFNFVAYDLHGSWDGDNPNLGPKLKGLQPGMMKDTDLKQITWSDQWIG